jgi:hypothetical protein
MSGGRLRTAEGVSGDTEAPAKRPIAQKLQAVIRGNPSDVPNVGKADELRLCLTVGCL